MRIMMPVHINFSSYIKISMITIDVFSSRPAKLHNYLPIP